MTAAKNLARYNYILANVQSNMNKKALQVFSNKIILTLTKIVEDTAGCLKFSTIKERMYRRKVHSTLCKELEVFRKEVF